MTSMAAMSAEPLREQRSTRLTFFVAGFSGAVWAGLVPFAQARAGLGAGSLGLLLLCLGLGSLIAMPLSGAAAARFGCRRAVVAATALVCLTLPVLAASGNSVVLEIALFAFGADPFTAALLATGIVVAALVLAVPHLLPYGSTGEGSAIALPRGVVLFIAVLCFLVFLTEGAALDWSAVYLSETRGMAVEHAGVGYAAFATAMFLGRLGGDGIVRRWGGVRVIALGGLCAAASIALLVLVPSWQVGVAGYALVDAGCANIVPVLYTAAGRQTTMPEHSAVPAVSTFGYAGILAGPAAIGFVAEFTSLQAAFAMMAVALVGVAASGRFLRRLV